MQAGIPRASLSEMQMLMGKNAKGARALRQERPSKLTGVLSETEEEFEEGGTAKATPADPMTDAVSKLTEIMGHLTNSTQKKGKSKLDLALDGVASSSAESSSMLGVKKSAIARRALRSSLHESPEDIYGLIERLMAEDMFSQTLPPGVSVPSFTARSWIEHRSHIGAWKSIAHTSWGVGWHLGQPEAGPNIGRKSKMLSAAFAAGSSGGGQRPMAASCRIESGGSASFLNVEPTPGSKRLGRRDALLPHPRLAMGRSCHKPSSGHRRLPAEEGTTWKEKCPIDRNRRIPRSISKEEAQTKGEVEAFGRSLEFDPGPACPEGSPCGLGKFRLP